MCGRCSAIPISGSWSAAKARWSSIPVSASGNGATVAAAVAKLRKGGNLYLGTTHFHPEHVTGQAGFPAGTVVIRAAVQQKEREESV